MGAGIAPECWAGKREVQHDTSSAGLQNSGRIFIAAAGAACVANASWWMQPLLMHELADTRQLGEFGGGMVLSAEMAAMALAAVVAARLMIGARLATLAVCGILLAVGGSALAIIADTYATLMLARGAAGAGAGLGLMMMNAAAAMFPDPDRAFARLSVVSIIYGMVIVGAMPLATRLYAGFTPFWMVFLALLATIPFVAVLPRSLRVKAPTSTAQNGTDRFDPVTARRIALLCAITFLIGCVSGMMWVFYALIGQKAGLSIGAIDMAISVAIFGALCAAGLASLIGGRFGRAVPVGIGLTVLAAAVAILVSEPNELGFRLGTIGNVSAIYFLTPYLFGAAAALDSSGRGAVYVGSAFYLTGAVGPGLGGLLAVTVGMEVMSVVAILIGIVSFVILWRIELAIRTERDGDAHETPSALLHAKD